MPKSDSKGIAPQNELPVGGGSMKTAMLLMFLLVSMAAFGQYYGSANSQAQPLYLPDHPMHAGQGTLKPEQSLLGNNSSTVATGELPMWEAMGHPAPQPSLGEVARKYREEHKTAEKATIVWNKQGE